MDTIRFEWDENKNEINKAKETLIKSSAHIAPSDFQSDCTKRPQEY